MIKNINHKAQTQMQFVDFPNPFRGKLNPKNKWVRLAELIPWIAFEAEYISHLSSDKGAPALPFRVALGSLIVKEKLGLSDRETLEQITENPYIQYFIGLPSFTITTPFDHSMFTHFRKRIKLSAIKHINETMLQEHHSGHESGMMVEEPKPNQGKLLIDATCAPSDIRYPTDVSLLNEGREKTEKIIDILWSNLDKEENELKPRTYRKQARKEFLTLIKEKKKSKRKIRKAIRKQLEYIKRNITYIDNLITRVPLSTLNNYDYKSLLVISELYRQQLQKYKDNARSIPNRIVSISQPHIRPIVRGKAASPTEFGAKISVSDVEGFVYLDRLEWEAYHEGEDLILQAEAYKSRFGFWPESIHADKAYQSRANRSWCKERNIRLSGTPLGRPPLVTDENRQEVQIKKKQYRLDEVARIEIEGKFGVAKRRYGLGRIMAKLQQTSETVIGLCLLVMNLDKILRDLFLYLFGYELRLLLSEKWNQGTGILSIKPVQNLRTFKKLSLLWV